MFSVKYCFYACVLVLATCRCCMAAAAAVPTTVAAPWVGPKWSLIRNFILTVWGLLLWLVFTVSPFSFTSAIPLPTTLTGRPPLFVHHPKGSYFFSYFVWLIVLVPWEAFFLLEDVTTRIQVKWFHQGTTVSYISFPFTVGENCRLWGRKNWEGMCVVDVGEEDDSRWNKILGNDVGWEGETCGSKIGMEGC